MVHMRMPQLIVLHVVLHVVIWGLDHGAFSVDVVVVRHGEPKLPLLIRRVVWRCWRRCCCC